jgi:hypothetical protein
MKKLPILFFIVLAACNNATDGDAATDTTQIPRDTNLYKSDTDTADHLNSSSGSVPIDTIQKPSPGKASKPTARAPKKRAPHDPARIDTMRQ